MVYQSIINMDQLTLKFPFSKKYYEQDYFVSSNNFSAFKLIDSWPIGLVNGLIYLERGDQVKHIFQKY